MPNLDRWGFNRSGLPQRHADGFWTPWHLADEAVRNLRESLHLIASTTKDPAAREEALLALGMADGVPAPTRSPISDERLRAMRSEARASDECEREHWFILFARAIERVHGVSAASATEEPIAPGDAGVGGNDGR